MAHAPKFPGSEAELPFQVQRKMVDWMDPRQLAQTGLRAVLSATFGAYADKREVQAALVGHRTFQATAEPAAGDSGKLRLEVVPVQTPDGDYTTAAGDLWIDFVADSGDGFDATHTIARLLAERSLDVTVNGARQSLPRADILIMGGDQVYPTPTREAYRDRLEGPYTAALPWVADEARAPHLYALPGNHDWYDGLTSFMRLFCHRRWIGGWHTRQRRSYFALKLPHGWWLWGIDIQLTTDIDLPQIEFFEKIARTDPDFAGSKVILCTGQPSWTEEIHKKTRDAFEKRNGYANLGFFEKRLIVKRGAEPVLTLTGDAHHYCRYVGSGPDTKEQRHKITAGGGGAYLLGTHSMPAAVELDDSLEDDDPPVVYHRGPVLFPSRKESVVLTLQGALRFPWKGRKLAALIGAFYLLNVWIVQSASKAYVPSLMGLMAGEPFTWSGFAAVFQKTSQVFAHSPACVTLSLLVLGSFVAFAGKGGRIPGILHGALHLLANLLLMWGLTRLNVALFAPADTGQTPGSPALERFFDSPGQVLVFSAEMLTIGSVAAGCLFGLYLGICALIPPRYLHIDEAFSAQAIPHFKNFLRIKIDAAGKLTLFPIGVRKIPRWTLRDKKQERPADDEPWFKPDPEVPLDSLIHLIEGPLEFSPPQPRPAATPNPPGRGA